MLFYFSINKGHGFTFVRGDLKAFVFINPKNFALFQKKINPRVIRWTRVYRRINRKGTEEAVKKKRTKRTIKVQKAIVGASLEVIKAKRANRPQKKKPQPKVQEAVE